MSPSPHLTSKRGENMPRNTRPRKTRKEKRNDRYEEDYEYDEDEELPFD